MPGAFVGVEPYVLYSLLAQSLTLTPIRLHSSSTGPRVHYAYCVGPLLTWLLRAAVGWVWVLRPVEESETVSLVLSFAWFLALLLHCVGQHTRKELLRDLLLQSYVVLY